jgi:hypothetical protein
MSDRRRVTVADQEVPFAAWEGTKLRGGPLIGFKIILKGEEKEDIMQVFKSEELLVQASKSILFAVASTGSCQYAYSGLFRP